MLSCVFPKKNPYYFKKLKYLNEAEANVILADALVRLGEKCGWRNALDFAILAQPLDETVVLCASVSELRSILSAVIKF